VLFVTLRADGPLDGARRVAVDAAVRSAGGSSRWRTSARADRTYALLELPDVKGLTAVAAASDAVVYDSPVIALAVFPAVAEALPPLLAALGGAGRPAGIRSCEPCDGGVVVEWDLERTPAAMMLAAVDVELRRFSSGRTAELLTPLPQAWIARIAGAGLQAAEITPDRVLETLIERAGLRA
jgi:hypothetical protein